MCKLKAKFKKKVSLSPGKFPPKQQDDLGSNSSDNTVQFYRDEESSSTAQLYFTL